MTTAAPRRRLADHTRVRPDLSIEGGPLLDLAGLDVLVIGINYAPEPTGIAPYTTGIAEYLAAQGARVTVLAGLPHYPTWSVDEPFKGRLVTRSRANGVDLVRLWHSVPRTMTVSRRILYEATYLLHALARTRRRTPDLILAVTPALGGAVAAARLARRRGAPLITVVQDLMAKATGESGIARGGRVSTAAARLEGSALRAASRVLIVSESFAPGVESYGVPADRIGLLRNWTHINPVALTRDAARDLLGWPRESFLAVHTGNMGFKQDLGNVVRAGQLLAPEDGTEFVLMGDGSQRRELEDAAQGGRYVRFADPVDEDTYPVVLAAADVLLVNERPTVEDMCLPSKLTSYLAADRPVVAAVADRGATCQELQSARAAWTIPAGRPDALVGAVRRLRQDSDRRADLARSGQRFAASRLSSQVAFAALHQHLRVALQQA